MSELKYRVYYKSPPAMRIILKNRRDDFVPRKGHVCLDPGMYADFRGEVPCFDPLPEAKRITQWMLSTGKIKADEQEKYLKRTLKEIEKAMETLMEDPEYKGKIWVGKHPEEEIKEVGIYPCPYKCGRVLKTEELWFEHLKEHREEAPQVFQPVEEQPVEGSVDG